MSTFPRDVLLRYRWGDGSLVDIRIEYIDRGSEDDLSMAQCRDDMIIGRSFFSLDDGTMIPYHRVVRIYNNEQRVWFRKGWKR